MNSLARWLPRGFQAPELQRTVWVSRIRQDFDHTTLQNFCTGFAARNTVLGLTGLLIRFEENYFQVLEGEPEVVQAAVRRIASDSRHEQFKILDEQRIHKRLFSDWAMSLIDFSLLKPAEIPGLAPILNYVLQLRQPNLTSSPASSPLLHTTPRALKTLSA